MSATHAGIGESLLPGFAPSNAEADSTSHQSDTTRSGWWVRRSAEQVMNSVGQPIGYRHQLMHGRQVISTGVGADSGRTFLQQAEFLNTCDEHRLSSKEPTDAAVEDQPRPSHD